MFTISKRFEFSASHQLLHLTEKRPDHPCARLHGHNYIVEVVLAADVLDADGFVQDFGDLAPVKAYLDEALDHRHLNDALGDPAGRATTAECLAEILYWRFVDAFSALVAVRVSETPKTWAEYRPA